MTSPTPPAKSAQFRTRTTWGLMVVAVLVSGCGAQSSPSAVASGGPSAQQTPSPPPAIGPMDLDGVVIPPDVPPAGMTLSDEGEGPATLEQLPLFPDTAAELLAAPGYVDGRWSRFAGSPEDFEASTNFILTWVAEYASSANAAHAFSILHNELTSEDHYGWDGKNADLGDAGTCAEGDSPQLGIHETICVWRRGPLVMVIGGGSENETPIEAESEAMDARAADLNG